MKVNLLFSIVLLTLFIIVGFTIGRYSDKYLGYTKTPHHWIYGIAIIGLGMGLFISDFNDFLVLPFYSFVELSHKWRFLSIE